MISRNIFLALPLCLWVFFVFFIYIFLTLLTTSILLFRRLIPQVFNSSCSSLPNLTSVCLRLSVSYRSSPQCVVSLCVFPTVGLCQALVHPLCVSWVSLFPLLKICFFLVDFFPPATLLQALLLFHNVEIRVPFSHTSCQLFCLQLGPFFKLNTKSRGQKLICISLCYHERPQQSRFIIEQMWCSNKEVHNGILQK